VSAQSPSLQILDIELVVYYSECEAEFVEPYFDSLHYFFQHKVTLASTNTSVSSEMDSNSIRLEQNTFGTYRLKIPIKIEYETDSDLYTLIMLDADITRLVLIANDDSPDILYSEKGITIETLKAKARQLHILSANGINGPRGVACAGIDDRNPPTPTVTPTRSPFDPTPTSTPTRPSFPIQYLDIVAVIYYSECNEQFINPIFDPGYFFRYVTVGSLNGGDIGQTIQVNANQITLEQNQSGTWRLKVPLHVEYQIDDDLFSMVLLNSANEWQVVIDNDQFHDELSSLPGLFIGILKEKYRVLHILNLNRYGNPNDVSCVALVEQATNTPTSTPTPTTTSTTEVTTTATHAFTPTPIPSSTATTTPNPTSTVVPTFTPAGTSAPTATPDNSTTVTPTSTITPKSTSTTAAAPTITSTADQTRLPTATTTSISVQTPTVTSSPTSTPASGATAQTTLTITPVGLATPDSRETATATATTHPAATPLPALNSEVFLPVVVR